MLRGDMINSGLIQGNQQITLAGDQLDNQQGGQLLSDGTLNGNITSLNNRGAMQAELRDGVKREGVAEQWHCSRRKGTDSPGRGCAG